MCVGDALWGCLEQRLDRVRESSRCLLKVQYWAVQNLREAAPKMDNRHKFPRQI